MGLPAHVKRDLDRAAEGVGRTPTTAHPDCICYKPTGRTITRVSVCGGETWEEPERGNPAKCPQHKPEKP